MKPNLTVTQYVHRFQNLYRKYLSKPVRCLSAKCNDAMLLQDWKNHVATKHGVTSKQVCAFCLGEFRWKIGDARSKKEVARHRAECLERFLKPRDEEVESDSASSQPEVTSDDESTIVSPQLLEMPPCSCVDAWLRGPPAPDMFGRARIPEADAFYEPYGDSSLFDAHQGPRHVEFLESSGLGRSAYNVFFYFFSGDYDFYHVMVRVGLWDSLAKKTLLPAGRLHVLPYWCLCDGTHASDQARLPDHRHMIWMMKKTDSEAFLDNWDKWLGPKFSGKNKLCKPVKTAHYLMNVVFYVSNRSTDGSEAKGKHYWMARELYPHAKLAMASLWAEGHEVLLTRRLRWKAIDGCLQHVREVRRRKEIQYKHLDLRERDCPLPLANGWSFPETCPVTKSTGFPADVTVPVVFVYGSPRVLERGSPAWTDAVEAWFAWQRERGNLLWNAAWNDYYPLQNQQCKMFHALNRVMAAEESRHQKVLARKMKAIRKLERKNDQLRVTNDQLRSQFDQLQRTS